jgi:mono/diheme cytochrome c family protein
MRCVARLLLLTAAPACAGEDPQHQPAPGESLFDGATLAGWSGDLRHWSATDGCLVGRSTAEQPLERSSYLFWDGDAEDFDLTFEYLIRGGNSGVQYRSERLADGAVAGYQADIEDGPNYTGILYESAGRGIMAERGANLRFGPDGAPAESPPLGDAADLQQAVRALEWNSYRISARGSRLIHEVNGRRMIEVVDEAAGKARRHGTFALQLHEGPPMEVRFRNLRLTRHPVPPREVEWIWAPGEPAADARRWFLHEFDLAQPATVAGGEVAADNSFILWLDGEELARGDDWAQPSLLPQGRALTTGRHALALEAWNNGGPAGLAARVLLRGENGLALSVVTDGTWKSAGVAPSDWPRTRALGADAEASQSFGPVGAHRGPWGAAMAPRIATPAESFTAPPGFTVDLIRSAAPGEGSWVAMTFGPRGEIYVSPQQGALLRLEFPQGPDAPPSAAKIEAPVHSAQGLCFAHEALYVNVQGGTEGGLHRIRDRDGDGSFEEHRELLHYGPPGEHGAHGVVLGPDGMLYVINGNHTVLPEELGMNSRFRSYREDVLLERIWDPNGHAVGVMAPGGYAFRVDADGGNLEILSVGMRNAYDLAFAPDGELFTYDSDMEWDIGAPWYRAPRVIHLVPGGEYGWRSGSAKWPPQSPDSLPPVLDTGPSSPTGTAFGTLGNFPGAWKEALYIADWAYGRITAVHLAPAGASYAATSEIFILGKPMNVADLDFGPDGALWFITGGRGTQSGLYRVRWTGGAEPPPARAAFATFTPERSLRRRLEDPACPLGEAWPALGHADRFVRTAARNLLERQPPAAWRDQALAHADARGRAEAMMALARVDGLISAALVAQQTAGADFAHEPQELRWLRVRTAMLLWMSVPEQHAELRATLAPAADRWLLCGDAALDREIAALLVALEAPGLPARLLERLHAASYDEERIHYAMLLRLIERDWTTELRKEFLGWTRGARNLPGGHSLAGFIEAIEREAFALIPPQEAETLRAELPPPAPPPAFAPPEQRALVRHWTVAEAEPATEIASGAPDLMRGARLFRALGCIQCHRVGTEGGSIGPDLTSAGSRFGRHDLLEAILEPQKFVSDQYPLVPMPAGLADTLKSDELRDLLAWLETRTAQ